jgi:hypothetical protein
MNLPGRIHSTLFLAASTFLLSCANDHFQTADTPPPGAPSAIELLAERQIATLHFPAGVYSFYGSDNKGFYYGAPRSVLQHTGGGRFPRQGGIFVSKRDHRKLRGYVFLAGGLTQVGDLSRAPYEFRN